MTKLSEEDIAVAVAAAVPAVVDHEAQLCRAALFDLDASTPARQYARGFLSIHDGTWLADFDAGRVSNESKVSP